MERDGSSSDEGHSSDSVPFPLPSERSKAIQIKTKVGRRRPPKNKSSITQIFISDQESEALSLPSSSESPSQPNKPQISAPISSSIPDTIEARLVGRVENSLLSVKREFIDYLSRELDQSAEIDSAISAFQLLLQKDVRETVSSEFGAANSIPKLCPSSTFDPLDADIDAVREKIRKISFSRVPFVKAMEIVSKDLALYNSNSFAELIKLVQQLSNDRQELSDLRRSDSSSVPRKMLSDPEKCNSFQAELIGKQLDLELSLVHRRLELLGAVRRDLEPLLSLAQPERGADSSELLGSISLTKSVLSKSGMIKFIQQSSTFGESFESQLGQVSKARRKLCKELRELLSFAEPLPPPKQIEGTVEDEVIANVRERLKAFERR